MVTIAVNIFPYFRPGRCNETLLHCPYTNVSRNSNRQKTGILNRFQPFCFCSSNNRYRHHNLIRQQIDRIQRPIFLDHPGHAVDQDNVHSQPAFKVLHNELYFNMSRFDLQGRFSHRAVAYPQSLSTFPKMPKHAAAMYVCFNFATI